MLVFIISFLLFFLPFVIFPFGTSFFESPKILIFEFAIIFLISISILKSKFSFSIKNYLPLLLIFLLTILHLLFLKTNISFFGNAFRMQGVFLIWNLLAFAYFSSQINIKIFPKIFYLISFTALFLATIFLGKNDADRSIGPLGEPNSLAATVLFLFPFIYFSQAFIKLRKINIIKLLGIIGTFTIVFLSGSRSGFIGFFIQLVFIALLYFVNHRTNPPVSQARVPSKIVLISFFFMSLSLALPFFEEGEIYENRSDIWKTSFIAGLKSPIVGGGFGNTELILNQTAIETSSNTQMQYVDSAHNILLDWWIQAGIIGLGALVYLIFNSFKKFVKTGNIILSTALLGMFTAMLFNPMSIVLLIYFWFILGQGLKEN